MPISDILIARNYKNKYNRMKKLAIAFAIVFGMTLGASAQGGGLMGYGHVSENNLGTNNWNSTQDWFLRNGFLFLPTTHGSGNDFTSPVGSGALLLIGFGAAYALKKNKQK